LGVALINKPNTENQHDKKKSEVPPPSFQGREPFLRFPMAKKQKLFFEKTRDDQKNPMQGKNLIQPQR
jgi:hypothetical protein